MTYRANPLGADELRRFVKERFQRRFSVSTDTSGTGSEMDPLVEALEIQQIELELQNEHLNAVRARLESALIQSAELYDFAPVGILTLDRAGRILKLNLAGANLLGSERVRLQGQDFAFFLAHREVAAFKAQLELAMHAGVMQDSETVLSSATQAEVHVQIRIASYPDAVNCQVILIDITARKVLEERLRQSAERWELALEAAGDGVWDWNVKTGDMLFSHRFSQLLGFAAHEFGRHMEDWTSRLHPDDKPQVMAALQQHLTGKTASFLSEHRVRCKDGSWKWIHTRGAVVSRSDDGQALRVIGRHVDISSRKTAEEALAVATQFQQAVFDALSAQVAVLDRDGTIVQTNAAWRAYGVGRSPVPSGGGVGLRYLDVLDRMSGSDPDLHRVVAAGIAAVLADDVSVFQLDSPFFSPADQCWFSLKVTPVRDGQGRVLVNHDDVTQLKAAELENHRLLSTDALTGAFHRKHFLHLAEQELARALRYQLPLMVLVVDLDQLKSINERCGHDAGDLVLQGLAKTLRQVLRESDLIGRMDGDAFAVLLPNTTRVGGHALAQRIVSLVRTSPVLVGETGISYTVSVGTACRSDEDSFLALWQTAEATLCEAMRAGGDRLVLE